MRRIIFSFLASLILVMLILASALPATVAQDSTPAPELTLAPTPLSSPANTQLVVSLPLSDTFDTNWGWSPKGAWTFDTQAGYDRAGWYLDGTQREMASTLEYTPLIDLAGTLSAQLIYRQKGSLPSSDLIAVDLSLDGGESWFMVDTQIGIDSDWELHIVDLTNYRGQVVRLRFRVNAGSQVSEEEAVTGGYSLDNLTIQFVSYPPVMVFAPVDTGPRTLMGLHLVVGAQKDPVIELVKRLEAIGWPLGTLKGTSGTEDILNQVAAISPQTVIVYRSLITPEGTVDCPNTSNDPVAEARLWVLGLQPYWRSVRADYYEITNECQPPVEWLVPFSIEAMQVAGSLGECLLLFSFSAGNPDPALFDRLLPVYEYALDNPCQPGRYHGIALHAYGVDKSTLMSESGINLGLRHRLFYSYVLPKLPSAIQIPVYLTEAGPGDGRTPFKCEDITRDVIQYTRELEYDPYIRGFHLWNVGPKNEWIDVTPCLSMIGDALVSYYSWKR
jgi:hypothetical protein